MVGQLSGLTLQKNNTQDVIITEMPDWITGHFNDITMRIIHPSIIFFRQFTGRIIDFECPGSTEFLFHIAHNSHTGCLVNL